jgi:hypothetical protein
MWKADAENTPEVSPYAEIMSCRPLSSRAGGIQEPAVDAGAAPRGVYRGRGRAVGGKVASPDEWRLARRLDRTQGVNADCRREAGAVWEDGVLCPRDLGGRALLGEAHDPGPECASPHLGLARAALERGRPHDATSAHGGDAARARAPGGPGDGHAGSGPSGWQHPAAQRSLGNGRWEWPRSVVVRPAGPHRGHDR